MGHAERTGGQGVDDRGEVGDVLEAEAAGVGRVDVGLGAAVHHHRDAAPAVVVGHELDPSNSVLRVLWHVHQPKPTLRYFCP